MASKKRRKGKKRTHKMMYKKSKGGKAKFNLGRSGKGHVPIKVLRHNLARVAHGIRRNPNATSADKEKVSGI